MASFGPSKQTQCGERPGGFTRLTPEVLDWVRFTSRMSCGLKSTLEMTDAMPMLNGSETKPHQFPWTVYLVLVSDNGQEHGWLKAQATCGGSLITQKHVLTSASCVQGKNIEDLFAILGAHNVTAEIEKINWVFFSNIYIYPDYVGDRKYSPDVAVLQLEDSVNFGPKIQPICLPSQLMTRNLFEEKPAILAGWNVIGPANAESHTGKFTTHATMIFCQRGV